MKIAAVSDIHTTERSHTKYQSMFRDISKSADILLLCGDLTDHGLPSQAEVLKAELQACTIPKVAVLGNHDCDNGQGEKVKEILRSGNLILLEDEEFVLENVGFAGVKGFGGGYGRHMLGAFGEDGIKAFVREAIDEVERLEVGLSRIDHAEKRVILMHYSPITDTLKGEPPEIFPFLGTSRFEEVINRFDVNAVFHGHAHYGFPEGKTIKNIPVYNVAYPLMQKTFPEKGYRLVEI